MKIKQSCKLAYMKDPALESVWEKKYLPNVAEFHYEFCRMLLCHEIYISYIFLLTHADEEAPGVIVFMEKLMAGC